MNWCAYAADGYSRVIGGMSAMITTFGVGELSASMVLPVRLLNIVLFYISWDNFDER